MIGCPIKQETKMALRCRVMMQDYGLVGEDDGKAAWHGTEMILVAGGAILHVNILSDSYSQNQTLRILRNDPNLDVLPTKTLLLAAYNRSSTNMRYANCEVGEAYFDLEKLIRELFYRAAAERLIRQIQSCAGTPRTHSLTETH
jgi:hypothetical protein